MGSSSHVLTSPRIDLTTCKPRWSKSFTTASFSALKGSFNRPKPLTMSELGSFLISSHIAAMTSRVLLTFSTLLDQPSPVGFDRVWPELSNPFCDPGAVCRSSHTLMECFLHQPRRRIR